MSTTSATSSAWCTPPLEQLVQEIDALPGWRSPLFAWAEVLQAAQEEARQGIEELVANDVAAIPRDTNFLAALAGIAHAVGELHNAEFRTRVEPRLAQFAD